MYIMNRMDKVREKVAAMGLNEQVIPFSARLERKLIDMSPEDAKAYCEKYHTKSQLPRIITTGYHVLNLIHFFTAGSDEVKCWTIRKGTLAPQAAGVIHTDFERGFICAEVYKFEDYKELKSEAAIKAPNCTAFSKSILSIKEITSTPSIDPAEAKLNIP